MCRSADFIALDTDGRGPDYAWAPEREDCLVHITTGTHIARAAEVDPFDRVQLEEVLRVCRASRSLSEAGRTLFAVSRTRKSSSNDADRLRKYLGRYGLAWKDLQSDARGE